MPIRTRSFFTSSGKKRGGKKLVFLKVAFRGKILEKKGRAYSGGKGGKIFRAWIRKAARGKKGGVKASGWKKKKSLHQPEAPASEEKGKVSTLRAVCKTVESVIKSEEKGGKKGRTPTSGGAEKP